MKINLTDSTRSLEAKTKRLINLQSEVKKSFQDLDILEIYAELKLHSQISRIDINKKNTQEVFVTSHKNIDLIYVSAVRNIERKLKNIKILQDIPGYKTLIFKLSEKNLYEQIPKEILGEDEGNIWLKKFPNSEISLTEINKQRAELKLYEEELIDLHREIIIISLNRKMKNTSNLSYVKIDVNINNDSAILKYKIIDYKKPLNKSTLIIEEVLPITHSQLLKDMDIKPLNPTNLWQSVEEQECYFYTGYSTQDNLLTIAKKIKGDIAGEEWYRVKNNEKMYKKLHKKYENNTTVVKSIKI